MTTIKIYIEIEGGCLQGVYGGELPLINGAQVEFILRDMDNINAGDPDPLPGGAAGDCSYYW